MTAVQLFARNAFNDSLENATKSLFASGYKQPTDYASSFLDIPINAVSDHSTTRTRTAVVSPEYGDLVHTCMVAVTMKKIGDPWYPLEALFESISVYLEGHRIDQHTNTWMRVYDELYRDTDTREAYFHMTNFHPRDPEGTVKTLYLPLLFWFCKDVSQSLPVQDDMKIVFELADRVEGAEVVDDDMTLVCEYIHVTEGEKELFRHREYRIETMQMLTQQIGTERSMSVDLSQFSHPTRALLWVARDTHHGIFTGSQYPLEPSEAFALIEKASVFLSGTELSLVNEGPWFSVVTPYWAAKRIPSKGIYVWEFGQDPYTSSGSINFSLHRNPRLQIHTKERVTQVSNSSTEMYLDHPLSTLVVFAPCWNWLLVKGKRAFLQFT